MLIFLRVQKIKEMELLNIIENSLLDKTEDSNTGIISYKVKTITNQQLNDIQLEVMKELTEYYTQCQKYYENGFNVLATSLVPNEVY